ncbi:MAG: hypothetical protein HOJ95_07105, partial [Nitrospinaceae bacterium]|nr:hypothetical protein [Nitrospinaceae bacterium]
MRPNHHLASAALLGGGTYMLTGEPSTSLALGAGCFVQDIDHIFDYVIDQGLTKGLKFLASDSKKRSDFKLRRLYLLFHGWDVLAALALLYFFVFPNTGFLFFLIGALVHLSMDQFGNPGACRVTYFLTYRISKGFRRE